MTMPNVLLVLIAGLLALVSQFLVIWHIWSGYVMATISLNQALALQLVAACIAGLLFAGLTPRRSTPERRDVLVLSFLLALFMPAAGQLIMLAMMLAPLIAPQHTAGLSSQLVKAPLYPDSMHPKRLHGY